MYDLDITSGSSEEILRIFINSELTFRDHITRRCSKINQKHSALARGSKYMALQKRHLFMISYFISQFNYCTLV